jgi:dephospho-CoA kinase
MARPPTHHQPSFEPSGERVLISCKPAMRSIAGRAARGVGVGTLIVVLAWLAQPLAASWLAGVGVHAGAWPARVAQALGATVAAWALVREALVWASRSYTLTTSRVVSKRGVVSTTRVEIPLRSVRQLVVDRTPMERALGLGTIVMSGAGSQMIDLSWVAVAQPETRLAAIRAAVDAAAPMPSFLESREREEARVMVLGLAGGVGSGKSRVARALEELGFVVIDSDQQARAALDTPAVTRELLSWWGPSILTGPEAQGGRVDRSKVAAIVFSKPEERARLEALVHPLVKQSRSALVARAREAKARGVVYDAPLLFEAGSDRECDAVLFVDAPFDVRLARVQANRGWDEVELRRREAAQMPLEQKRARSHAVVVNDADEETLRRRVAQAVATLEAPR